MANAEKDVYWYDPDHLGSSSFVTNVDGEVNQNIECFPSGEVPFVYAVRFNVNKSDSQ